jgi:outer membrane protein assembly factor BamB
MCLIVLSVPAWADNWPQFRGADHNYLTDAANLPEEWSASSNIKWKTPIEGRGWASPVVWGDKVFIAAAVKEIEGTDTAPPENYRSGRVGKNSVYRWELHCLDLKTGKPIWKQTAFKGNPRVRTHPRNTYASETPVTDGKHVYVYFGMIGLYCYDMDGELIWQKDLGGYEMLGDWGTSSSPILHDGKLYLQIDNDEDSFLTALDPKNGDEIWRVNRDPGSSWSSPMIWKNKVRTELVTNAEDVRGYDAATGKLLWSLRYPGGRASSSPTGDANTLFVGNEARRDGGGIMYAVTAGATGDITPKDGQSTSDGVIWSVTEGGPDFASPLIYQGQLYVFGRTRGFVGIYNPLNGERLPGIDRLPGARSFWASPWAYDGKVYCSDERGQTFVVSGGEKVEYVATNKLDEPIYASPALLDNGLILRGENHVYRIGN